MATPPPSTVFQKTDFDEDGLGTQGAIDKFFTQLNSFTQATRANLNGGLSSQNLNAEFKTFTLKTPSTSRTVTPVALTAAAGWTPVLAPNYTIDSNGWVEVFGVLTGGVLGSTILTGVPAAAQVAVRPVNANNAYGRCVIGTNGTISFDVGSVTNVNTFFTYRATASMAPDVLSCFPALVKPNKVTSVQGVWIAGIYDTATPTVVRAQGGIDWTLTNSGLIQVNNIEGLALGRTYTVTLYIAGK